MNKKWEVLTMILLLIIVLSYSSLKKNYILSDYKKTQGKLINFTYDDSWETGYRHVRYEYFFNNKRFIGGVYLSTHQLDYCKDNLSLCYGKRFWVIHSSSFPSLSLIDLSKEIRVKNPDFPKTLKNFE